MTSALLLIILNEFQVRDAISNLQVQIAYIDFTVCFDFSLHQPVLYIVCILQQLHQLRLCSGSVCSTFLEHLHRCRFVEGLVINQR